MKILLLLTCCSFIYSCSSYEDNCSDFDALYPIEKFTLYKKNDTTFSLIKAFKISSTTIKLSFVSIIPQYRYDKPLQQIIIKEETHPIKEIDNLRQKYAEEYNWSFYRENKTLFIQIQPTKEILNGIEDIDLRNDIEYSIDLEFQKNGVGEFWASDLGPGGLNMLCEVENEIIAMKAILKVLCENSLEKNTIVCKRIFTAKDNWIYEVVYPKYYSGIFDSM